MTFLFDLLFKLKNIDKTEETISKEAIQKAILTKKDKQNSLKNNFNKQFKNQQNIKTQEVKQNINFEL